MAGKRQPQMQLYRTGRLSNRSFRFFLMRLRLGRALRRFSAFRRLLFLLGGSSFGTCAAAFRRSGAGEVEAIMVEGV